MIDERDIREMLLRRASSISALPTDPVGAVRRSRRRVAVTLGASALVAAALVLGTAISVDRLTAAPPARPASPTSLPGTPEAWSRAVLEEGQRVSAILPGGPGLIALGAAGGPAILTSSDGRTWTPASGELGGGGIRDVVAGGPGFVAVGSVSVGDGVLEGDGVVWTSTDGVAWDRVPPDPVFEGASLSHVVAGGPGVVAFGRTADGPRAWSSSDGVTWHQASVPALPPDVAETDGVAEAFVDAGASSGGRLIVFIKLTLRSGQEPTYLWTSTDGVTWTDVLLDPEVFPPGSGIDGLVGGPDGWVAVGMYRYRQEPGVWTSEDGLTWRRVAPEQDAFVSRYPSEEGVEVKAWETTYGFYSSPYEHGGLVSVAANESGFVAVGADGLCPASDRDPPCLDTEAAVWTSIDGQTWTRVASGPVFQSGGPEWMVAEGVVAWGPRFVAWGRFGESSTIWISDPSVGG